MRNGKIILKIILKMKTFSFIESLEFSSLTSKVLWSQLTNESKSRYSFDLNW